MAMISDAVSGWLAKGMGLPGTLPWSRCSKYEFHGSPGLISCMESSLEPP